MTLKFSSGSWHVRMMRWWYSDRSYNLLGMSGVGAPTHYTPPRSLCVYFWLIFAYLTFVPFFYFGLWGPIRICWEVYFRLIVWPIRWVIVTGVEHRDHRRVVAPIPKPHRPSLVLEILKAGKRKVCPLIEIEEEE